MEQEELTPNWLSLRHRITFAMRRLRGGSNRLSDIRVAIYRPGRAHRARPPHRRDCARAAEAVVLRRARRAKTVLRALGAISGLVADPDIIGLHISPKGRGNETPMPGSLYAWAAERFA